jgi:XTP/dITP diphosphohydrolase
MAKKKIVFASNNKHKVSEIQQLLGDNFELLSLKELNYKKDIPEDHNTLEENALQKARTIYTAFGIDCIADDTGLEVTALNGAPGVKSARYSGKLSDFENEQARTAANINKLLNNLQNKADRSARFRTVIALIEDGKETLFEGIVEGEIISTLSGSAGFGYDPVFVPKGYVQTFAQMDSEEKNAISHRGKAVAKLIDYLKNK